jgi:hypothetical protein
MRRREVLPRRVNAHDVGAHVGQHHSRKRAGSDAADLEDLDALQRTGLRRLTHAANVPSPRLVARSPRAGSLTVPPSRRHALTDMRG